MSTRPGSLFTSLVRVFILISITTVFTWFFTVRTLERENPPLSDAFNEKRAMQDVEYQTNLGPRIPNSKVHQVVGDWIRDELVKNDWEVVIQEGFLDDISVKNIIAKRGVGKPWTIIGAHYDTRIFANKDPDLEKRQDPVPGANDGASGVAVLLEISRVMSQQGKNGMLWLVFFDAEDNGSIENRDWVMGSQFFVDQLTSLPDRVVILDMIGDQNLDIYQEKYSDHQLTQEIWETADKLGYGNYFITEEKYSIIDDHIPFIMKGIPAVDIIDFNYPHWHTTHDTVDKVSAASLKIVGETIIAWLRDYPE
jgi:glutaminyl-peptide cyclotransferase